MVARGDGYEWTRVDKSVTLNEYVSPQWRTVSRGLWTCVDKSVTLNEYVSHDSI